MADRINALIVVLDKDYREDDIEVLVKAINCLRGVIKVKKNVSNIESEIAESRVKRELTDKLYKALE